jgi:rRNA processing protein Gar1
MLLIRPNKKICAILVSKVFGNVKTPYINMVLVDYITVVGSSINNKV